MKTLDLNAYGVTELSCNEMLEVDGGNWKDVVAGICTALVAVACVVLLVAIVL
jgi:hypothetical protein